MSRGGDSRHRAERGYAEEAIIEPPGVASIAGAKTPGFAAQRKASSFERGGEEQLELSLAQHRRLHRFLGSSKTDEVGGCLMRDTSCVRRPVLPVLNDTN